jgi:hypothetical protein
MFMRPGMIVPYDGPPPITTSPQHPAIAGMLEALPHPSAHWPPDQRSLYIEAFKAVLDLVYARNTNPGSSEQQ